MDTIEDLRTRQRNEELDFIRTCPHNDTSDWEVSKKMRYLMDKKTPWEPDLIGEKDAEKIKRCKRCNQIVLKQRLVENWETVDVSKE